MTRDNWNAEPKPFPARNRRVRCLLARVTRIRPVQYLLGPMKMVKRLIRVCTWRSGGNSKRSNSNRLPSDDEAIYCAACGAQSKAGQIYIKVDKLNGWPEKVLLDTGCTGMIVDRALILDSMGDTRQFRLFADGRPHSDR